MIDIVKPKIKELFLIPLIAVLPTLLIWLIFYLRLPSFWSIPLPQSGMATIVSNYDGPLYMVVAKSLYAPGIIKGFQFALPVEYYAAHFPLFPVLIRLFSPILGTPYSMLAVTVGSTILCLYFFNKLANNYFSRNESLWLTLVFSVFPARFLIVRSVGSPEPLFLAGIIASIYYFNKKNFWLAGLWGMIATLTKSPGILLFLAYAIYSFIPKIKNSLAKIYPILLIPLALAGVFLIFKIRLDDFWAYFHSGDNIHLIFPPFSIFNYSAPWVGTFWLEEIIFVYLLGAYGTIQLIKSDKDLGVIPWFTSIFFIVTLMISHRDIIRYSLPLVPFLYLAYGNTIIKKEFKYVFALLIIPIFLFSLAYISQNVMPISDWSPFL
jgi:hypothetical protein